MGKNQIIHYRNALNKIFDSIMETQMPAIEKAANVIINAYINEKAIHVIGTGGHSNMGAEEVLWRAGGLAFWNVILDPGTNLIHGAKRSNFIERTEGYSAGVLDSYRVGKESGEVIVIINAYGINSMTIDTVQECRKRGVIVIGVTSESYADSVPAGSKSRHSSAKNLHEEADIYINSFLPLGDAVVDVENYGQKICSTSTFCNCFVMNCLTQEIVSEMVKRGIEPPVFMSANMPQGDEHNKALEKKYGPHIKHLL